MRVSSGKLVYFCGLFCIVLIHSVACDPNPTPVLLESPGRTDITGDWGRWSNCPPNQYVNAVNLKIELDHGTSSKSGLNGIKLFCAGPGRESGLSYITSLIGSHGTFMGHQTCSGHGFVTGFQLKSDLERGRGSNNIRLFCNTNGDELTYRPNFNQSWGNWTERQDCPMDHAICGIQTQVEFGRVSARTRTGKDRRVDTGASGIHNIKIECCQLTVNCDLEFKDELIFQFDNRDATTSHTEHYSVTHGYGFQSSESNSESTLKRTSHNFGISAGAMLRFINVRIGYDLDKTSETYKSWSQSSLTLETKVETFSRTINVPPGWMIQFWQPVVNCDGFVVKNKIFRRVDIPATVEKSEVKNETFLALETEIRNLQLRLQLAEQAEQECSRKLNETVVSDAADGDEIQSVLNSVLNAWG